MPREATGRQVTVPTTWSTRGLTFPKGLDLGLYPAERAGRKLSVKEGCSINGRLKTMKQDILRIACHDLQAGNMPTSCCSNCRPGLSGQTAFSAVNLLAIASSSDSLSSSRSCDTSLLVSSSDAKR